ncbi:hypothetical protein ACP4OV_010044 [Aristida adscensionis]
MGNCIQSSSSHGAGEGGRLVQLQTTRRGGAGEAEEEGDEAGTSSSASVVKVKMVVTKGELGWLVSQLNAGDRRLHDVLGDMARKREAAAAGDGWRPSLDSIVE